MCRLNVTTSQLHCFAGMATTNHETYEALPWKIPTGENIHIQDSMIIGIAFVLKTFVLTHATLHCNAVTFSTGTQQPSHPAPWSTRDSDGEYFIPLLHEGHSFSFFFSMLHWDASKPPSPSWGLKSKICLHYIKFPANHCGTELQVN